MKNELHYWIALRLTLGIGNVLYKSLIEHFGSPDRIFTAPEAELAGIAGMSPKIIGALQHSLANPEIALEIERAAQSGIDIVTLNAPSYPASLKTIYDPPPYLYVKGMLSPEDRNAIAVVGSRKASDYGLRAAGDISRELAGAGLTVVSGMARGIDTAAHRGALAGGGRTIAVLGCGPDVCYPPENRRLYDTLAERGAIVSEYPLGTEPNNYNFPARNRIISGLARGILVVEASPKSGSLITARLALDQGREVFAVPGSIYSFKAKGTNQLIRSGATLVESARDITESLGITFRPAPAGLPAPDALAPEAQRIYDLLAAEPVHIDRLICEASLPSSAISSALLELELGGFVKQLPGKHFIKYNA